MRISIWIQKLKFGEPTIRNPRICFFFLQQHAIALVMRGIAKLSRVAPITIGMLFRRLEGLLHAFGPSEVPISPGGTCSLVCRENSAQSSVLSRVLIPDVAYNPAVHSQAHICGDMKLGHFSDALLPVVACRNVERMRHLQRPIVIGMFGDALAFRPPGSMMRNRAERVGIPRIQLILKLEQRPDRLVHSFCFQMQRPFTLEKPIVIVCKNKRHVIIGQWRLCR